MLDGNAAFDRGGELGGVLAEAAVTDHRDDRPVRVGCPRPDRRRVTEPDGPEVSRYQRRLPLGLEVATQGGGVVANVHGHDSLRR